MAATLRTYLELVRFSHTVFAMPFAIMAVLIAATVSPAAGGPVVSGGTPWPRFLGGVLVCMVTARTAAMAFNRLVDRSIDAANPRTASRHLPRGDVEAAEVMGLVAASCCGFIAGTLLFLPNWLPVALSAPVLAWLLGYSYAKRFTMLAHVWLGVALGLAPVAAWIAIRGGAVLEDPRDLWPAAVLGLAVAAWVTGFDTIYACQDAAFDAAHGLHSLPARVGVPRALRVAAVAHGVTVVLLAILPALVPQLGIVYWAALVAVGGLLLWEHAIVRPEDLSRVNEAFFTANALVGFTLLTAIAADLWF